MESNISRDHIAMEAMKVILSTSVDDSQTIWNKISVLFGGKSKIKHSVITPEHTAYLAYQYADAMMKEREKGCTPSQK